MPPKNCANPPTPPPQDPQSQPLTATQRNQSVLTLNEYHPLNLERQYQLLQEMEQQIRRLNAEEEMLIAEFERTKEFFKSNQKVLEIVMHENQMGIQEVERLKQMLDEARANKQRVEKDTEQKWMNLLVQKKQKEEQLEFVTNQYKDVKLQREAVDNKLALLNQENKQMQAQLLRIEAQIKAKDEYIEDCYMHKKRYNNQLQEQRGSIRVNCRIKPFPSTHDDSQPVYQLINENTLRLKVPKDQLRSDNTLKQHNFNFEHIFDMDDNQGTVFSHLDQLVQSAVDGKNVCIFAYGQTGSGKTYTMQGGGTKDTAGIIPRSIQLIFSQVKKAEMYKWQTEVSIMIQQVYLQNARDLLTNNKLNPQQISLKIVKTPAQVYSYLEQATKNRKVAQTNCNEHSSRSHLIFTLLILSRNAEKGSQRRGSLNLVDLAGSQRVSLSKVEGERLKQTQAINKSLTCLGQVITGLANKDSHVPFRNSKLTFLLQKYLEGDSRTLMFVNISPEQKDYAQTLISLRFAEKVKECKLKNRFS